MFKWSAIIFEIFLMKFLATEVQESKTSKMSGAPKEMINCFLQPVFTGAQVGIRSENMSAK